MIKLGFDSPSTAEASVLGALMGGVFGAGTVRAELKNANPLSQFKTESKNVFKSKTKDIGTLNSQIQELDNSIREYSQALKRPEIANSVLGKELNQYIDDGTSALKHTLNNEIPTRLQKYRTDLHANKTTYADTIKALKHKALKRSLIGAVALGVPLGLAARYYNN